ncbi:Pentatricopeptide repeat-containing protein [Rhynchospora pubera]|uniref:Pentatricopeptide repeat-containing protein n=1 Tax=Rhynchospora pubera TaxID=906938 RepID=A0AAV8ESL7_9POAL|nr:Pentatricopeptide repeat-containing protein [Rhynchospora pubera]
MRKTISQGFRSIQSSTNCNCRCNQLSNFELICSYSIYTNQTIFLSSPEPSRNSKHQRSYGDREGKPSVNPNPNEAIDPNLPPHFDRLTALNETHESDDEETDGGTDQFDALDLFDKNPVSTNSERNGEIDVPQQEDEDEEELEESGHPLVREACRLISLRHEWNPTLESQLRHLLRTCNPRQVRAVLRAQKDERVAVNFFYWADRQWRYRHAPEVFGEMLKLLSKTKLCESSRRIMRLMIRRGIRRNPKLFAYLMVSYSRAGKLRAAMRVLSLMQKDGIAPDITVCNTAIHVIVMAKRLEKALCFLDRMQRVAKHGHAEEALEFVREAERNGFRVDSVGYSAVIHAFCRNGLMNQAKEIMSKMLSNGHNPDVVTYTSIVNGFCRLGQIDEAKRMVKHMYKYWCKPNTVTYTSILHGLCRVCRSVEALEMLNKSEEEWWVPSGVSYSVVMHGLRREGKLKQACDLISEMLKKGFFPTTIEINLFIQALCKEGKAKEAKTFMQECLHKGCAINVVNFTTLIHGFCKEGDLEAALSLLDDMYLNNKHPDVYTYTIILDNLGKKGRFEDMTNIIKRMLQRGVTPSPVTYRTVIHRFCLNGKVEELVEILDRMLTKQDFRNSYNMVIEKLCRFGFVDKAYDILPMVLRTGSRNDVASCDLLIGAYLEKGSAMKAYKVACRVFNRNLVPNLEICAKVAKRLDLDGCEIEGRKLREKFVERGLVSPHKL